MKYQYFTVDPGFTEDKWVRAAQIIPGNRAVVHHILVFAKPPRGGRQEGAGGGAYLVGLRSGDCDRSRSPTEWQS